MAEKNSFAADIGLLQAQASAMQGNLEAAQATADRAVDLKYQDALSVIDVKFQQLKLLEGKLNREESKLAEQLKVKYEKEKNKMSIQMAQEKDLNATLLNAMQTYPDAKISLNDTIETANAKIVANSKIYANKVRLVGGGSTGGGGTTTTGTIDTIYGSMGMSTINVLENPSLFGTLTPSKKTATLEELRKIGININSQTPPSVFKEMMEGTYQQSLTSQFLQGLWDTLKSNLLGTIETTGSISNPFK
jgi:hypothetical protein